MTDLLTQELDQGVLTLTLGAGPAHPLSLALIAALRAAYAGAESDPAVRVIVLHGPGRIFCAGHDLKEMARHRQDADQGLAYLTELFEACAALMLGIGRHRCPSIARVEGIATAAGLQLVAACDLAFATPEARFCLPGIRRGGFCTTPGVAVSRSLGRKALMDLMLSGDEKSADWALAAGLVNAVLPADGLAAHVTGLARTLARRYTPVSEAGRACTLAHLDLPLEAAYAEATRTMIGHFMDPALHGDPGSPAG